MALNKDVFKIVSRYVEKSLIIILSGSEYEYKQSDIMDLANLLANLNIIDNPISFVAEIRERRTGIWDSLKVKKQEL